MSLRPIFGILVLSTACFFVSLHFHWPPYAGIAVRKSYKGLASLVKISNTSTWTVGLNNTTHVGIMKANVNTKTLQAYKDVCQSRYKKPGPDSLCEGRPTLRTQWLEHIPHNWSLPTASDLAGSPRPKFPSTPKRFLEVEFKCMSQATEDGILLAIFNALGTKNRRGIEIAAGLGWESNLMNLAVNFDFDVLFFEGGARDYTCLANFLSTHPATAPRVGKSVWARGDFVTRETFNSIIYNTTGWTGDIDVLSIDIDGIDFWLWDTLDVVSPRVVVVEIQELWGPYLRRTRPYDPGHVSRGAEIVMTGASLGAFSRLARDRGYRLVGCIQKGYNAFFVRNNVLGVDEVFGTDEYNASGCFAHVDETWGRVLAGRKRDAQRFSWVDPYAL